MTTDVGKRDKEKKAKAYDYEDLLNLPGDDDNSDVGTQETSTDFCATVWKGHLYVNSPGRTEEERRRFCGDVVITQNSPMPDLTGRDLTIERFSPLSEVRSLIRALDIKTVASLDCSEEESKALMILMNYMAHHDLVRPITSPALHFFDSRHP